MHCASTRQHFVIFLFQSGILDAKSSKDNAIKTNFLIIITNSSLIFFFGTKLKIIFITNDNEVRFHWTYQTRFDINY